MLEPENYSKMAIWGIGQIETTNHFYFWVTLNAKVYHKICNNTQPVLACYTQQSLTVEKYELKTNWLFL